jgi:hypothetical protein
MSKHDKPADPSRGDGYDPNRPVPPPPAPGKHEKK